VKFHAQAVCNISYMRTHGRTESPTTAGEGIKRELYEHIQ